MCTEVILKADHSLFGNMLDLFAYPLGPLPWSLANANGTLKKTKKTAFGEYLEKLVSSSDFDFNSSSIVIDAMALIQKLQGENHTFEEVSNFIFK